MNDMNMNYQTDGNSLQVKNMGFFQRIIGILLSPGAVMENLAERPRVLFGILASIFTMPLFYLSRFNLYVDSLRQKSIQAIPFNKERFGTEITPEMIEQQLPFASITGIVGAAVMGIVVLLITTLIFFAIFKILGGQGKFKAYLSVSGYAYVVMILYFLVAVIASFFTGKLSDTQSLTSIVNLLPSSMKGSFVYGMANSVDIFNIWYYVVLGIGMGKVSKCKKSLVYAAILVVFLIVMIIGGFGAQAAAAFM